MLIVSVSLVAMVVSSALSASAADSTLVKVNVQYGANTAPITVKQYTAAQLASICTTYTDNQGYLYYKSGTWQLRAVKTGVPIDTLLANSGVSNWTSGSSLKFTCSDGAYTKYYPTYDQLHGSHCFYPATTAAATDTVSSVEVSAVVATQYKGGAIPGGSTAGDTLASMVATPDVPTFFVGLTQSDTTATAGGFRFPSGVTEITVVSDYQLQIKSQVGTAAPTVVKSYSLSGLRSLATSYTADARRGYLMKGPTWSAFAVDNAVDLSTLLVNAGASNWLTDSHLEFTCFDGAYTKYAPTYSDLNQALNFYPATTASATSTTDATSAPAALAMSYGSSAIPDGSTAGDVLASVVTTSSMPRFFVGVNQSDYATSSAAGKRFPAGLLSITIVSPANHTLAYTAGVGGSIEGSATQSVTHRGASSQVSAVADTGYQFAAWSDGATSTARTDATVTADATFTVSFVKVLPKASIAHRPAASSATCKRKHGVAKYTLSATVKGWGGAADRGDYVYLQVSRDGKKFGSGYKIRTSGSGKADKTFRITTRQVRYYRWYVPARAEVCLANTSSRTRVSVK